MPKKALAKVKVVEWAQFVSGPYCSKLLADLGAEVIKIEKPGTGDESRRRGPFPNDIPHPEKSGLFFYLNTNKRGITLNMENPAGRKIFKELIQEADILIEDHQPKVTEKHGLDYQNLIRLNPRLIVTSITPFGQTGPLKDLKAYHLNTYHSAGLGYLTPQSKPGTSRQPLAAGGYFGEYGCGLIGAVATLGALHAQRINGRGQQVDISKQEALLSLCMVQASRYPNEGVVQNRFHSQGEYGDIYQCKDGHIVEMTNEENQWQAFVELMGNPEWAIDERYKKPAFRKEHYKELNRNIAGWMMEHTKDEIYHEAQKLGFAVAPVMNAEDIVNSEQSKAREFFSEADHAEMGRIKFPSAPYKLSASPWAMERSAPLLGQHNEEIYCKRLGFSLQELEDMKSNGIM
ncbi:MAG: CoA transferase [Thermodesulfobacteriota bacterium]|nr:CoA transferase [Thermodesulfobacteriota bacterium]